MLHTLKLSSLFIFYKIRQSSRDPKPILVGAISLCSLMLGITTNPFSPAPVAAGHSIRSIAQNARGQLREKFTSKEHSNRARMSN